MPKIFAYIFTITILSVLTGAVAPTIKEYPIDPATFDGAKFADRYSLDFNEDFKVRQKVGGQYILVLRLGLTLPDDPPIIEPPDSTKRDRLEALRMKLSSQDLSVPEINDYLRLRDGI